MRIMNAKVRNAIISAIVDMKTGGDCWDRLGELLYYRIGSELASRRDWNSMTFLQLEHEARVQGLLGPKEQHRLTQWRLRLMLEIEARQVEAKERKGLPNNVATEVKDTPDITNKNDNQQDEVEQDGGVRLIFTRKDGIKMVF
jgi:hypothetical protein